MMTGGAGMCGRYHFSFDLMDEVAGLVEGTDWKLELGLMDKDIHPGEIAPVITARTEAAYGGEYQKGAPEIQDHRQETGGPGIQNHRQETGGPGIQNHRQGTGGPGLQIRRQRWGFPGPGGKGLVFNARSESVTEKPMFREGVARRRVAVPVSWFYEWNKSKEKYTFTREGSRVLFLAGFYNRYQDGEHFVILTTEANSSMAPVHSRMPLILDKDQVRDWILDSDRTRELLGQVSPELLKSCEYEQQTLF